MSDYVRSSSTFFGDKDALASGNANKVVKGSEFDTEFNAIATAVNSKYDSADRGAASGIAPLDASSEVPAANLNIASAGEATARTGDFLISAGVFDSAWDAAAGENAGAVLDIQALTDPNADRILFWDDSDGAVEWLTATEGVTIDTNDLKLDITSLTALSGSAVAATDEFVVYDADATAHKKIQYQSAGIPIQTKSAAYTAVDADMNNYFIVTNASEVDFDVDTGVGETGNVILVEQGGAGQVNFGNGTATITSAGSVFKTGTENSVAVLVCTAANTWTLYGDIAA